MVQLPNLDLSLILAEISGKFFFLYVYHFSHVVNRGNINGKWTNFSGLATMTSLASWKGQTANPEWPRCASQKKHF